MRLDSYEKLTEKEYYIAQYYFGQKEYLSALGRYEIIIEKYSPFGYGPRALKGAIVSAFEVKQKDRALGHYSRLVKNHPNSSEAKYIKREYKNELR